MPESAVESVEAVTLAPNVSTEVDVHRIPALDGIRGIAILLVLLNHGAGYFPTTAATLLPKMFMTFGWSGVDLFFVLSGFLITGILIRTKTAVNRASSFYIRRILRIFPLYYSALCLIFVVAAIFPTVRDAVKVQSGFCRGMYFLYLQNWLFPWHSSEISGSILGHFWSLAVEEQFYLLWPFLIWNMRPGRVPKLCFTLALCSLGLRVALVSHFGPNFWINVLTPTRGEGLLIGSGIAALSAQRKIANAELLAMACLGISIIGFIFLITPGAFLATDRGPFMYTVAVTGLGLLFAAVVGASDRKVPILTRLCMARLLRSFGKYSYGVYIVHIPVYVLTTQFLARRFGLGMPFPSQMAALYLFFLISLSYGLAWASFHVIERRFLNWKDRFAPRFGERSYEAPDQLNWASVPAIPGR